MRNKAKKEAGFVSLVALENGGLTFIKQVQGKDDLDFKRSMEGAGAGLELELPLR